MVSPARPSAHASAWPFVRREAAGPWIRSKGADEPQWPFAAMSSRYSADEDQSDAEVIENKDVGVSASPVAYPAVEIVDAVTAVDEFATAW